MKRADLTGAPTWRSLPAQSRSRQAKTPLKLLSVRIVDKGKPLYDDVK